MARDLIYPLFTLNTVLFPGGRLQLKVFEARYVDMVARCLREKVEFGVCLIREGQEVGGAALPEEVGTLARILEADMPQAGVFHLKVTGLERFVVEDHWTQPDGLVLGRVVDKPAEAPEPVPEEFAAGRRLLAAVAQAHPELDLQPERDEMPWLGYRLAEVLPLKPRSRQAMLEMNDSRARLEILLTIIRRNGLG